MSSVHCLPVHPTRGVFAMLAAVAAFAVMDAAMKHLAQTYPPMQVSFLRGLASIPFFLLAASVSRQWRSLLPTRWSGHLIRGALAIVMLWTYIYALSQLSLGTTYGIVLCLVIFAVGAGVLPYSGWMPLKRERGPWILLVGLSGAVAQYLFIQAFRSAPVSLIAPLEYTALIWGVALDWVLWNTIASARELGGGSVVVSSGLYLIYREYRASRAAQGRDIRACPATVVNRRPAAMPVLRPLARRARSR